MHKIKNKTLPAELTKFLQHYHQGGIKAADCLECNSCCCYYSGFALLENVEQIYDLYKEGVLSRKDYAFPAGLTFKQFVFLYFDVVAYEKILFFHPKHLSADSHLISIPLIPDADYWEVRNEFFDSNPWFSKGCIFLSEKVSLESPDNISRRCLLHADRFMEDVTAKPVACLFFTCRSPREFKMPDRKTSLKFFELLAKSYPGSVKRFEKLIAGKD